MAAFWTIVDLGDHKSLHYSDPVRGLDKSCGRVESSVGDVTMIEWILTTGDADPGDRICDSEGNLWRVFPERIAVPHEQAVQCLPQFSSGAAA
jgi:hypothetical protein